MFIFEQLFYFILQLLLLNLNINFFSIIGFYIMT